MRKIAQLAVVFGVLLGLSNNLFALSLHSLGAVQYMDQPPSGKTPSTATADDARKALSKACGGTGIFSNCRTFVSYSSGGVRTLGGAAYNYSSGSSSLKVNPVVAYVYIPDNPNYFLPILTYANAKLSANSQNSVRNDILDNEGGLGNIKIEYDYFPYFLVANKGELGTGKLKNKQAPAAGLYFEFFGGAKLIQGTGLSGTGSGANDFLQWQSGAGIDLILPVSRKIDFTDPKSISKDGDVELRAIYVYNHANTSNIDKIFPGTRQGFYYGSVLFNYYLTGKIYLSAGASGLNTNHIIGDTAFVTFNLVR